MHKYDEIHPYIDPFPEAKEFIMPTNTILDSDEKKDLIKRDAITTWI